MKNSRNNGVLLRIGDKTKLSIDITLDDLVILYRQFIDEHHRVPTMRDCISSNNLPQSRIISKLLKENGVDYKKFASQFGKTSHVRVGSHDFDFYLKRYKEICDGSGRALTANELKENNYGLPSASWFVDKCNDARVKTYDSFVIWCGYKSNKLKRDKAEIINALISYEKSVGRPITVSDIKKDNIGFSMVVIKRLFGTLSNARKECGLVAPSNNSHEFEIYRNSLADLLIDFRNKTGRDTITWREIDSKIYGSNPFYRKTYIKHFEENHVNIFQFMKTYGVQMNPSGFSTCLTFNDGERVRSSMEYDMSKYLRSIGLQYNKDYHRDVRYSEFYDLKSRIDCDYVLLFSEPVFIEVAGVIYNPGSTTNCDRWLTHSYASKFENEYRDKMKTKKALLEKNNAKYCFVFMNDMQNGDYRRKIQKLLREVKEYNE